MNPCFLLASSGLVYRINTDFAGHPVSMDYLTPEEWRPSGWLLSDPSDRSLWYPLHYTTVRYFEENGYNFDVMSLNTLFPTNNTRIL